MKKFTTRGHLEDFDLYIKMCGWDGLHSLMDYSTGFFTLDMDDVCIVHGSFGTSKCDEVELDVEEPCIDAVNRIFEESSGLRALRAREQAKEAFERFNSIFKDENN